ncbi:multicopper oxidase [Mactra antiquata]
MLLLRIVQLIMLIASMHEVTSWNLPKISDYKTHPCRRNCLGSKRMTCEYDFIVEHYQTLSRACYNCPHNITDCYRPHCVPGDGFLRAIKVVNRMMPGPAIHVCQYDEVVVNVYNELTDFEGTSIHWHGILQEGTPHMDGVAMVTQCPIPVHSAFQYRFYARNAGTHYWHAHAGLQRGDGIFGALVVRNIADTSVRRYYDQDLPEHTIIFQDWMDQFSSSKFALHHHGMSDNEPSSILIDGRGPAYQVEKGMGGMGDHGAHKMNSGMGDMDHSQMDHTMATGDKMTDASNTHTTSNTSHTTSTHSEKTDEISSVNDMTDTNMMDHSNMNSDSSMPDHSNMNSDSGMPDHSTMNSNSSMPHHSGMTTESHTMSPESPHNESNMSEVPHSVYNVEAGRRYRFRLISNGLLNCPLKVSVENHTLNIIASDGYDTEPIYVDSLTIFAGERFDVVLTANQKVGNYWLHVMGLGDCAIKNTSQSAIIRYKGAANKHPETGNDYADSDRQGKNGNPMGNVHKEYVTVAEMTAEKEPGDVYTSHNVNRFYMTLGYNEVSNPRFLDAEHYPLSVMMAMHTGSHGNHLFALQMNYITFKMPMSPVLSQLGDLGEDIFCNETHTPVNCREELCECVHRIKVQLNDIVELVLISDGKHGLGNHPMHLHGHSFYVLGMETLNTSITREMIKEMDIRGKLVRNLKNPIKKDTVMVPDGGYTIIRFKADNPGFWLFHCHVDFHFALGMSVVVQVGEADEMTSTPNNFPRCGSWHFSQDTQDYYEKMCAGYTSGVTAVRSSIILSGLASVLLFRMFLSLFVT